MNNPAASSGESDRSPVSGDLSELCPKALITPIFIFHLL